MKKPYKHFDLPTQHLANQADYIPPKARQREEIERRKSLPRGTLLLEQQQKGLRIASLLVGRVVEQPDMNFVSSVIAAAGINSAWYSYAKGSQVMRRRLILPYLAADQFTSESPNRVVQRETARQSIEASIGATQDVMSAMMHDRTKLDQRRRVAGRTIGDASLRAACLSLDTAYSPQSDPFEVQAVVRATALDNLENSRTLGSLIGTAPTLAQLADADSDLAVYIRRQAPNGAYVAFEEAYDTVN